jgi:excisionase family DNA binding protein
MSSAKKETGMKALRLVGERPPSRAGDRLLTLVEVAEVTRATAPTVRHWITVGKLKAVKPGRHLLVWRSELDRFLAAAPTG